MTILRRVKARSHYAANLLQDLEEILICYIPSKELYWIIPRSIIPLGSDSPEICANGMTAIKRKFSAEMLQKTFVLFWIEIWRQIET